jgi:hypothetical protein
LCNLCLARFSCGNTSPKLRNTPFQASTTLRKPLSSLGTPHSTCETRVFFIAFAATLSSTCLSYALLSHACTFMHCSLQICRLSYGKLSNPTSCELRLGGQTSATFKTPRTAVFTWMFEAELLTLRRHDMIVRANWPKPSL